MNYLSELFLSTLNEEFSFSSLQRALQLCNAEYESRHVSEQELRDFYDVSQEFNLNSMLDLSLVDALSMVA